MPVVVGIQFKPVTKLYHFTPGEFLDLATNDFVIVETAKGQEVAQVVQAPHGIADQEVIGDIKPVVRRATPWDLVRKDLWAHKEQEALAVCRSKARESRLEIKIVRCEYNFDGGRLLIFFSAESRVDFRDLVRDLARIFRTRIEMRQIGVRDEAKLLDGVGKCGRQLCCTSWLRELPPSASAWQRTNSCPSTRTKSAGSVVVLLCCLSYEDAHYKEQNKKMPKLGAEVVTPQGIGRVRHVHPLKETVTVMLENMVLSEFAVSDLVANKAGGGSCGTCGGCTVKRRAGAEADNERVRKQIGHGEETEATEPEGDEGERAGGKRRRRRRSRPGKSGGEKHEQ